MHIVVTFPLFLGALVSANCGHKFSTTGARKLFVYLEGWEYSPQDSEQLDVSDLCARYTECTLQEAATAYSVEVSEVKSYLEARAAIIYSDDKRVLYSNFG